MEATGAELADRPWRRCAKNSLSIGPLRASVAPNSSVSLSSGFLHAGLASAAPPLQQPSATFPPCSRGS
jgi:hypothetical protein